MTWSYSGDPSSSDKDAVRFIIGDTDTTSQLLSDEEIQYLLDTYTSVMKSAYYAALAIASKCATLVRQETGRIKVWANDKYKQYRDLAQELKDNINNGFEGIPKVYAGGISHTDKCKRDSDPDQVKSPFFKGMHDNLRGD